MARTVSIQVTAPARPCLRSEFGPRLTGLRPLVRSAVLCVLEREEVSHAVVDVTLVGDEEIERLNRDYLGRGGATDVIAFALHDDGDAPLGDVYIDAVQAVRQALELGESTRAEIVRLAAHGTLHVLGHDHPLGAQRENSAMWREQERIVAEVMQR